MPRYTIDDGHGSEPDEQQGDDGLGLAAEVVVSRDRPAECTLYPVDADDMELMTHWITASGDAFVSLEAMR